MRAFRCLLAALLAAGIVSLVSAQPGGRFGGGFGGGGDVDSLVFTNAALQDEVKVTADQKEKIKPVAAKMESLSKKMREAFGGGFKKGGGNNEKFAELREEGKKVAEERKKVFDDVFSADQKKRLKQIQIQTMSFRVFNDPEAKGKGGFNRGGSEEQKAIMKEVQDALKLSDSQRSSIKGIASDYTKESQEIYKDAGFGRGQRPDPEKLAAVQKKVEKVRKEAWGKVEDLLDDSQKKTWKALTGAPFDTSKLIQPRTEPKKD
jgi:hypothetical protein